LSRWTIRGRRRAWPLVGQGGLLFGGGRYLAPNVATSMTLGPNFTWARRNRRPMIQQLRKASLIWPGCADVPMSKSFRLPTEQEVADAAPTR